MRVLVETIYGPGLVETAPGTIHGAVPYAATATKPAQIKLTLCSGAEFYMLDTEKNARAVLGKDADLLKPEANKRATRKGR